MSPDEARLIVQAVMDAVAAGASPPNEGMGGGHGLPPSSISVAAEALGLNRGSMRRKYLIARRILELPVTRDMQVNEDALAKRRARRAALRGETGGPPIPEIARPPEGFVVAENSGAYDADGNLLRQWVRTKRDAGEEFELPAGHFVKEQTTQTDQDGRVLTKWTKSRAEDRTTAELVEALKQAFAEYEGAGPVRPEPQHADEDLMTLYPLPDLHLGMRAWGEECGADYDLEIASRTGGDAVSALVNQARPSRNAVVVILGDFYHQNDSKNATPMSNHLLDVDGRWPKVYLAGAKLAISVVDMVATKHHSVEVVVLPGNHDKDAAVTLAVALGMFYSKNTRIHVNLKPGVTWYRRFGRNLIGANHGHTMKTAERMAMAMAVDCAEDWGQTDHRIILAGHLHHEIAKEVAGVRVETLGSPAARDAWNSESGYRSSRALSAITLHTTDGEIGRHRVNIVGTSVQHAV